MINTVVFASFSCMLVPEYMDTVLSANTISANSSTFYLIVALKTHKHAQVYHGIK